MKLSDYLKGISVLLDSTIKDIEEWENECEKNGRKYWNEHSRKGATKYGILNSIAMIRRMLLQVSKEVSE